MSEPSVHNPTGMSEHDVTSERWREYEFVDGFIYIVRDPVLLHIKRKESGDSHRIVDAQGITHYIPESWRILRWSVKEGEPAISF